MSADQSTPTRNGRLQLTGGGRSRFRAIESRPNTSRHQIDRNGERSRRSAKAANLLKRRSNQSARPAERHRTGSVSPSAASAPVSAARSGPSGVGVVCQPAGHSTGSSIGAIKWPVEWPTGCDSFKTSCPVARTNRLPSALTHKRPN